MGVICSTFKDHILGVICSIFNNHIPKPIRDYTREKNANVLRQLAEFWSDRVGYVKHVEPIKLVNRMDKYSEKRISSLPNCLKLPQN